MENIFYYYVVIIWLFVLFSANVGSSIMSTYSSNKLTWFLSFIFFHFFLFVYIAALNFKKLTKAEHKKMIFIVIGYVVFVIVPLFIDHYQ